MKKTILLLLACFAANYVNAADPVNVVDPTYLNRKLIVNPDGSLNVSVSGTTTTTGTGTTALSGTQRGLTVNTGTSSITFAAGAKSIDLLFSSDFTATVVATGTLTYSGATLSGDRFEAPTGDTLPVIPLTVTSGTYSYKMLR